MDFQQTYNALCAILQSFGNVLTKHRKKGHRREYD